jgi:membrane-anchored glycerophosphoryl diester phosphodiesterase (GDPDase)
MNIKKKILISIFGIVLIGAAIYFASVYQKVQDTSVLTPEEFENKYRNDN